MCCLKQRGWGCIEDCCIANSVGNSILSVWYRYVQKGAEAIHAANPNVLVVLPGLSYDKDLSFIQTQPVSLTFSNKLVFEVHWYGFTDSEDWEIGNPNQRHRHIHASLEPEGPGLSQTRQHKIIFHPATVLRATRIIFQAINTDSLSRDGTKVKTVWNDDSGTTYLSSDLREDSFSRHDAENDDVSN
nr:1,4-alpha-glucan-branching enzyme [Tanacetum cinerariifolium]